MLFTDAMAEKPSDDRRGIPGETGGRGSPLTVARLRAFAGRLRDQSWPRGLSFPACSAHQAARYRQGMSPLNRLKERLLKSPFPGMDPYIEACGLWGDFHHDLISEIKYALAEVAPERYLVRAGERSYVVLVEEEGKTSRPFVPDVSVTTERNKKRSRKKGGAAVSEPVLAAEPVLMRAFIEEEHQEAFVEIYEARPRLRLVTSIEVLSPSNKRPHTPGWDLYLRKRQSLLLGETSLVEIDLLRGGQRMPMLDPWPDSPYTFLVARAKKYDLCQVWPVSFQIPSPSVPIPLAKPDPDILLNLQAMIDSIYQRSRYERSIDYRKPLSPPLLDAETAWLKKQLRSRATKRFPTGDAGQENV
jgi:hypothetical protein